jgi:hypothetical protein
LRGLAQAARAPGCAAPPAATGAGHATHAATEPEPDATEPDANPATAATATAATAATTEADTTAAATKPATAAATKTAAPAATVAAAATTASAGQLHAAANVFPVEDVERRETDVEHFLFAKNEALIR